MSKSVVVVVLCSLPYVISYLDDISEIMPWNTTAKEVEISSRINPPEYLYGTWNDVNDPYDYWRFGNGVAMRLFVNRDGRTLADDFSGPFYDNVRDFVEDNSYTLIWHSSSNTHVYRFVKVSDNELLLLIGNVSVMLRRSSN